MWSHAHENALEFSIVAVGGARDGELLYWTNDWEHPPLLEFDPPLRMESGEGLQAITTYHNGTDEYITYGLRSTDEMQMIFYIYYPDYSPGPGAAVEWPEEDLFILDEDLLSNWRAESFGSVELVDLTAADEVHRGNIAVSLGVEQTLSGWRVMLQPDEPVHPGGYTALRFAFHPGDVVLQASPRFRVEVNSRAPHLDGMDLLEDKVDFERKEWQLVDIPLEKFRLRQFIDSIRFSGNLGGTFFLDDIRLVAAKPSQPGTAVVESRDATIPATLTLSQNYPNPFNPETTIRFDLAQSQETELAIYNLSAQRVATLVQGHREAGSYSVRWDGVDDTGLELASGVYFYRLKAGERVETRKLLLLR